MPPRTSPRTSAHSPPAVAESVDAFRRILRALRIAARETQAMSGLSAAQLFVLSALADGDEASLSDLATRTLTDRSSVASVVDRLLGAGMVVRATSREDRRRAAITITAAGRAVLRRAPAPPTAMLVTALEALPPRRLSSLAVGLRELTAALGLENTTPGMLFEDGVGAGRRARRTSRTALT